MPTKQEILKIIYEAEIYVKNIDGLEEFNDDEDIVNALLGRSGDGTVSYMRPRSYEVNYIFQIRV